MTADRIVPTSRLFVNPLTNLHGVLGRVMGKKRYGGYWGKADDLISPSMAAEELGISRQRMHQLMKEGRFQVTRYRERPGLLFLNVLEIQAFKKLRRGASFRYRKIDLPALVAERVGAWRRKLGLKR